MKTETVTTESMDVIRLGKDEMNLAEFPITLLSDRAPKDKQVIEYQDQVFDEKANRTISRKLTISADQADGLPTAVDDDVLLALIQLTKKANNFTSREVEFSRLELIRMLDWPDSGASYKRLKTSLKRWLGVKLVYDNAWWDNRQQSWKTKGFHIIDNFEVNDARVSGEQGELFPSKVIWNVTVFESFQAGYLKSIDYGLYRRLNHPTAKRMYRFLSKRMYHRPDLVFDLRDLAFEHVGLSRSYSKNAGKIKEKLQPALTELEEEGFLRPMGDDERYQKDGKQWKIRLAQAGRSKALAPSDPEQEEAPSELASRVIAHGVTKSTALKLVADYPADRIEAKLDVLGWLIGQADKRLPKNQSGYLVKSIQEDYAPPVGYASPEERKRKEEKKQAAAQEAEEALRRQEEGRRIEQAERDAITAYLQEMSEAELAAHDARSREAATPEDLVLEQGNNAIARMARTNRHRLYAKRILREQGKMP